MKRLKKILKVCGIVIVSFFAFSIFLYLTPPLRAYASSWVSEATNVVAEYTKYPIEAYTLDFYVDTSWSWLPWNWGSGVMSGVYYGLFLLTNMIWMLNAYVSYFIGFVVEQAYNLDFLSSTVSSIALNMQEIGGVDTNGFKTTGLFPMLILPVTGVTGLYFMWVGVFKKQTAKAVSGMISFLVILFLSMGFIAYSGTYLSKITTFSKDFNTEILTIGTKLALGEMQGPQPNSKAKEPEKSETTLIRDSLFDIQIKKPWQILQFGSTEKAKEPGVKEDEIGEELLGTSLTGGWFSASRDEIVKFYVDDPDEKRVDMSIQMVPQRLGMTLLLLVTNGVISFCVVSLAGIKIFSEVMFIIYACFLPVALAFSLIPTFHGLAIKAVLKMFNSLLTKSGVTLIMTVTFSISMLLYNVTENLGFIFVIFIQIVTFLGIRMKTNELLGYMNLNSSDSEQSKDRMSSTARKITNMGRAAVGRNRFKKTLDTLKGGNGSKSTSTTPSKPKQSGKIAPTGKGRSGYSPSTTPGTPKKQVSKPFKSSFTPKNSAQRFGQQIGKFASAKDGVGRNLDKVKDGAKNIKTNTKFASRTLANRTVEGAKKVGTNVKTGLSDVKTGVRMEKSVKNRQRVAEQRRRKRVNFQRKQAVNSTNAKRTQSDTFFKNTMKRKRGTTK